jgi:two-component system, LytTR family, sensor kinase
MSTHPFLRNRATRIAYLGIWLLMAGISYALVMIKFPEYWKVAIADTLFFHAYYAFLALALWNAVRYTSPEKLSLLQVILHHLLGISLTLILWLGPGYLIISVFLNSSYTSFFIQNLAWKLITGVFYYFITVLIYYLIVYYQNFRESLIKEAELQTLMKEAELSLLRSQIKPHFLFNSLNSISSLTLTNPDSAHEMIIKLSDFIRYSLAESERNMVSLRAELDYIRLYLDIEKVRFGDKLQSKFDMKDACLSCILPNMILQPLYENAVKHGVYESTGPVEIFTTVNCTVSELKISIRNNFDPESIAKKGKNLGLKNITNRLKLIYQREDLIKVEKQANLFSVIINIPQIHNS